jgi:hypothetical protein
MEGGQAKIVEMTKKLDILGEFDYFAPMFMWMNEEICPFSSWKRFCKALELLKAMPARDPPAVVESEQTKI